MTGQAKKPRSAPRRAPADADEAFHIVGLGASAGGLEALEIFLRHTPADCGLAFVIVQHLDPTHKGMMVDLLQRATAMPVAQIKDRMPLAPNRVYVIPPNRDLSVLHAKLHLLEPAAPRGLRLPIDYFFRSLADDQQERSIGVILSGMGSDGTLGLRAIKEKAGCVFVQTPDSARFDGMPRSAIEAGLADVVAPPEELPGRILAYLQHLPGPGNGIQAPAEEEGEDGLEKVILLLRTQSGHDFSLYKKSTLHRRIERRMGLHQLTRIMDYVRFLRGNPQEIHTLFKELLIGVTSFFRDPEAWDQLRTEVMPALLAAHREGDTLRAWVPACSTGEEAYSLAIVFRETLDLLEPAAHYSLRVFATDLDKDAIEKARTGIYPRNIAADVSEERLRRFFVEKESTYRVTQEIRDMVTFAPQNLVMDPPFTRLDVVTCRNMLIYLEPELQRKLLPLFHYSLVPGGYLMLGTSEALGQSVDLFDTLPGKKRLYRRREGVLPAHGIEFPTGLYRSPASPSSALLAPSKHAHTAPNLQALTDRLLVEKHAPVGVLTSNLGDILYLSGKTGKYLEPATGKANLNIFAMAREGLNLALNEVFHKALRRKAPVTLESVKVGTNGGTQFVNVTVEPVTEPAELKGMVLVVLADVAPPPSTAAPDPADGDTSHRGRLAELALELQRAREELQATRDEMQTSQEELKSTNEEFQSTNEELQSSNEELTTSKEEMQSMNEELQTVNSELQAKMSELTQVSDDLTNLFNANDIGTLFLDRELKVRRFTPQTAAIIKLIAADIGRPITDIVSRLDYTDLATDARQVLRRLEIIERQAATADGNWFMVRIIPYRTQDDRIDGIVITFVDITMAKRLEATLTDTIATLQARFDEQKAALDEAQAMREVSRKTQIVLEGQIMKQAKQLDEARKELKKIKGNQP